MPGPHCLYLRVSQPFFWTAIQVMTEIIGLDWHREAQKLRYPFIAVLAGHRERHGKTVLKTMGA
jgi:hypothetical protein